MRGSGHLRTRLRQGERPGGAIIDSRLVVVFVAVLIAQPGVASELEFDVLRDGLVVVDRERDGVWLKIDYRYRNMSGRRIGVGAVHCTAEDAGAQRLAAASDRVTSADLPLASQQGLILLRVGDEPDPTIRCQVEVSYWLREGKYVKAPVQVPEAPRPVAPVEADPS